MMSLHGLLGDLRQALRQFGAAPAWSATVVAVLALGIGLALATFMLVDALLFRPLGVAEQERVVKIAASREYLGSTSYPAFLEYRARSDVFAGVETATGSQSLHWRQPDGSRLRVTPQLVSGGFFGMLGLVPATGRLISPADDTAGAPLVVVLSNAFWQSRFGGRSDVVGEPLALDDRVATVVGVLPADFRGLEPGGGPDVYLPIVPGNPAPAFLTEWSFHWLKVYARMKPGVTLAQADAQIDAIARARDVKAIGGDREMRAQAVAVFPLAVSNGEGSTARTAWMLIGGSLLILLTACANATGLLLVRAERRRGELAVRASLGADAARLARTLLAESLMLSLVGAALGLLLAVVLADAAIRYGAAASVLQAHDGALPALSRAAPVAVGLAVAVAFVSGLLPALRPRTIAVVDELKAGGGGGGGRRWRIGRALVGAQFALTVVLVVCAGLLLRSLAGIWATPIGVAAMEARVLRLDYARDELDNAALGDPRSRQFLETMTGAPGVAAVGIAAMAPASSSAMSSTVSLPERTDGKTENPEPDYNPISAGFFAALSAPLVTGRDFGPGDVKGSAPVAIVSETFARRYFPGVDPVGRHVEISNNGTHLLEIVGVARDIKLGDIVEPFRDVVYVPYEQRLFGGWFEAVVRPAPDADAAALAAIATAWRAIEPARAVPVATTMRERVAEQIATPRFLASTLGAFAALALLLAATGIYGAFAFWVSVRRRELGLRLAVGASAEQVFRLVLGDGLRVIAAGAAAGVLVALALARLVASALVGVSAYDAMTYILVPLVVAAAGLLAAMIPARNAARIDPQQSLRCE